MNIINIGLAEAKYQKHKDRTSRSGFGSIRSERME